MFAYRVASRHLIQEIEGHLRDLEGKVRLIRNSPGHAGATLDGIEVIENILTLFDEAAVLMKDSRFRRGLESTRGFYRTKMSQNFSNEWFLEMGEYVESFPDMAKRWLEKVSGALGESSDGDTSRVIDGVKVRNATGHPGAIDDLEKHISRASKLLKRRGWASLLRGEVKIVSERQMPSSKGHAGAFYRHGPDDIFIAWPSPDYRDLTERLVHEAGHRLWFKFLSAQDREDWTESYHEVKSQGGRFVSRYAGTNAKEDFAETFAYWVMGKPLRGHEQRLDRIGLG